MLTLDDAPQLFEALKAQYSPEGRTQLIELHYPLILGMARKYARRIEREPDDYIGVGSLALVEAVDNSFRYMVHNEISKYVVTYARGAMRKFYREDRVVRFPAKTQDTLFRLGHLVNLTVKALEPSDIALISNNDLLDSLIDLLPDLIERQVLMLRLSRYTDREIAVLLAKDVKDVRTIRRHIKEVLNKILED